MTYIHLATEGLVMIEACFHQKFSILKIATYVGRSRQRIYNVVTFLRKGYTALDYFKHYKENKKRYGRHSISLPYNQQEYIQMKGKCKPNGHKEKSGKHDFKRNISEKLND